MTTTALNEEDQETDRPTNTSFVNDFMNWGSPMNQVWLMEACHRYAAQLVDNKEQVLKDMEGAFISGPAWVACAEKWQKDHKETFES